MAVFCPLCQNRDTFLIADRVRFDREADVRRCRACDLVFLDQESFTLPGDFYEASYHQTYLTHIEPAALDPQAYYEKMKIATKPWCDRINAILQGGETVLDFGCSTGHVMMAVKDKAGKVFGQELNRREIEFCRDVLKLEVSGEAMDRRFPEHMFDYIIMIFVFEHIADPVGLLKYLRAYLKPEGRFIILVPNIRDALVQFYDIQPFARFYYCVEHLYYYSPKTITDVFHRAGLVGTVETLQEYPITNHLNWGYRQKPADVLASRRLVPDVPLLNQEMMAEWERFWMDVDRQYKDFLTRNNFGDRLWCLVRKDDGAGKV